MARFKWIVLRPRQPIAAFHQPNPRKGQQRLALRRHPDATHRHTRQGLCKTVYGIGGRAQLRYAAIAPVTLALGRVQKVRNTDAILTRKGVEAVVVLEDAVAVVADNPWRAEQAARAVEMDCEAPPGEPLDSDAFFTFQRETMDTAEMDTVRVVGDPAAIGGSGTVVEAEYYAPYLAHTPMEPLNATIWTEGDKVHCASGVQDPMYSRKNVADTLEIPVEDLTSCPFHGWWVWKAYRPVG